MELEPDSDTSSISATIDTNIEDLSNKLFVSAPFAQSAPLQDPFAFLSNLSDIPLPRTPSPVSVPPNQPTFQPTPSFSLLDSEDFTSPGNPSAGEPSIDPSVLYYSAPSGPIVPLPPRSSTPPIVVPLPPSLLPTKRKRTLKEYTQSKRLDTSIPGK